MVYALPDWLHKVVSADSSTPGKQLSPQSQDQNDGSPANKASKFFSFNTSAEDDQHQQKDRFGGKDPAMVEYIESVADHLRNTFSQGTTKSLEWRKTQLKQLRNMITENEQEIWGALKHDLGKGEHEAWLTETQLVVAEIDHCVSHLSKWLKPKKVSTNWMNFPGKSQIYRDPLGVACIISPWNYPINLLLIPFVGAIAGGNCAVLKPSEIAEATSNVIAKLVPKYMDRDAYAVVTGGVTETTTLLDQKWDIIFYTGSSNVGKKVMAAAAKHLTPVILELGGKSPTYVSDKANVALAARRICWGKFTNAGQTCIAPDYLMVHRKVMDKFLEECHKSLKKFYESKDRNMGSTPDYGRIINDNHFNRLSRLLMDQRHAYREGMQQPRIAIGGGMDPNTRYIEPTILTHVTPDHAIMDDEIFGPILPIMTVENNDQAIGYINSRTKPLAMYIFTNDNKEKEKFLTKTTAGGVLINDCLLHLLNPDLPFGGVGTSGIGSYHGERSIMCFTHEKSVLKRPGSGPNLIIDPFIRYPSYTPMKKRLLNMVFTFEKYL